MATEVLMPQMGADMSEGILLRWLVQEGAHIERGDPIAEIETDKANVEIEAFESGTFLQTLAREGEVIPVGKPIALIGAEGEAAGAGKRESKAVAVQAAPESPAQARTAMASPVPEQAAAPTNGGSAKAGAVSRPAPDSAEPLPGEARRRSGRVRASPLARRIAEEWGVDLSTITGTGPDGRIVRRDIEAAAQAKGAAPAPAAAPVHAPATAAPPVTAQPEAELRPLSRIRQTIARRMAASKRDMPHYYVTIEIDMTDAAAFREQVNASDKDLHVTVNDIIVRATAVALERHPEFNALFSEGGITIRPQINVCIAIALDEGLIAPAIIDTNKKSLRQTSFETRDLAERARSGRLRPEEYGSGTFTVSNLGMYGIDTLLAIIQPGQSAILGIGAATPRPVVRDGEIVVRRMMTAGLSADHRATDGAQGAQFLQTLRDVLEHPLRLVL